MGRDEPVPLWQQFPAQLEPTWPCWWHWGQAGKAFLGSSGAVFLGCAALAPDTSRLPEGFGHLWIICVGIEAHPGNWGLLESAKGMGMEEKPAWRSLLHNPAPGRIPEPRYPRAVPGIAGILWNTGKFFWPLRLKEEGETDRAAQGISGNSRNFCVN